MLLLTVQSVPNLCWAILLGLLGLRISFSSPSPDWRAIIPSRNGPPQPQSPFEPTILGLVVTGYALGFGITAFAAEPDNNQLLQIWLPLQMHLAGLSMWVLAMQQRRRPVVVNRALLLFIVAVAMQVMFHDFVMQVTFQDVVHGRTQLQTQLEKILTINDQMVNLPGPILLHAVILLGVGLKLTFASFPSPPHEEDQDMIRVVPDTTLLGIATFGLGVAYLATADVPMSENQWLQASGPVRMVLGTYALALLQANRQLSGDTRKTLWGIFIYDLLGGLHCSWSISRVS